MTSKKGSSQQCMSMQDQQMCKCSNRGRQLQGTDLIRIQCAICDDGKYQRAGNGTNIKKGVQENAK